MVIVHKRKQTSLGRCIASTCLNSKCRKFITTCVVILLLIVLSSYRTTTYFTATPKTSKQGKKKQIIPSDSSSFPVYDKYHADSTKPSIGILFNLTVPSLAFPSYQNPFPCTLRQQTPTDTKSSVTSKPRGKNTLFEYEDEKERGILYVKQMLDTGAGIAIRIAHRHGKTDGDTVGIAGKAVIPCRVVAERFIRGREFAKRLKKESFLWSFMRDPTSRTIALFFHFRVMLEGEEATDGNFKEFSMESPELFGGGPLQYTSTRRMRNFWSQDAPKSVKNSKLIVETVNDVLRDYDFLGIVERYDESLVALRLLLDLDAGDIIYMRNTGTAWKYDEAGFENQCAKMEREKVSPAMREFFESVEWKARIASDILLYEAANISLDKTIQNIGKEKFRQALAEHDKIMNLANKICTPTTIFPCSADGKYRQESKPNCYKGNAGCGYSCLDDLMTNITQGIVQIDKD